MDLSTTYMGLKLKSPLMPGASPLTADLGSLRQMEDHGAGAVVLHSLFEEQLTHEQKELHHYMMQGTEGFAESLSYFPDIDSFKLGPEEYLEHIRKAKESLTIPVIASLNGVTRGGWIDFARQIEQAGADGLELNVYFIPTNPDLTGGEVEAIYLNILAAVKSFVQIPVAVKLSPFFSSLPNMAHKLDGMGANALVLFNRFYQPDFDLEEMEVKPRVRLSRPGGNLMSLRWIAILYGHIKASMAATTGIHTAEDVIKSVLAGADATQLCSVLLQLGVREVSTILDGMKKWMDAHDYESVAQMKGVMSQKSVAEPAAFERANYMKALQSYK
ncbi:dihydroorotate dehydrogenase-like protein [bacterium]|nr:dihydroorotate dehydrogenase-like protein [bacterium]